MIKGYDIFGIARMATDINVIRALFNNYNLMKEDTTFNIIKYIKLIMKMLKGERIVKHENSYVISTFLPRFPSRAFTTNMLAVPKDSNKYSQQMLAKRSAPISMYICVTEACPNSCVYCSAKHRKSDKDLSLKEWKNVIKDLQEMKTSIIGITGGEPLLRSDIVEIVSSVDERSSSILFTTGKLLTPELARKLKKAGLFAIGISLDSYDPNQHNHNRKDNKAHEFALKAMGVASEAGLYVMAQTVILKERIVEEDLFDLFKLAKQNGAHEVKILEPVMSGELLLEGNFEHIFYSQKDRENLIDIQFKANKRRDMPKITSFAYTESKAKYGCGAGNQHSYISASGELFPCDFIPMTFGNVSKDSVKELWPMMSESIGKPKVGCFAQLINSKVVKISGGTLPLNKKDSSNLCYSHHSKVWPDYYKL